MKKMLALIAIVLLAAMTTAALARAADAGPLRIVGGDPFVRDGVIYRCRVQRAVSEEEFTRGPCTLRISLTLGGGVLGEATLELASLGQLLPPGVAINLVPEMPANAAPDAVAAVRAVLDGQPLTRSETAEAAVETLAHLRDALERVHQRLRDSNTREPLPWLWMEQAAGLALQRLDLGSLGEAQQLGQRVSRWVDGERPQPVPGALATWAWRDEVDGSVQPFRLLLPPASATPNESVVIPLVVILAQPATEIAKHDWPTLPEAWLQAARNAGVAVLEPYPAGDRAWGGLSRPRARAAIAAAKHLVPALDSDHPGLIGVGSGAQGATWLAEEQPGRFVALACVAPRWTTPMIDVDTDATQHWLNLRRFGGQRPEHLTATALGCVGERTALTAWLSHGNLAQRCERLVDPAQAAFWTWLLTARTYAPGERAVRRFVAAQPGMMGPFTVAELGHWGTAGILSFSETPQPLWQATGIARLGASRDAAAVLSDQPAQPERPTGAKQPPWKSLGQATGPLDQYADRSFVIVIGSSESQAAATANRALAQAFLSAWVVHAQGAPVQVDDRDFLPERFPLHHLVLIGNSRSNSVLRTLVADGLTLPARWDERLLTIGSLRVRRSQHRAFALAWPHPQHDGRLLVILDGALPPTPPGALPLAGLPDLYLAGTSPNEPPTVFRLFGNGWE